MDELQQQTAAGQSECLHSELSYKRLERGHFIWPTTSSGAISLTPAQLATLLEGCEWRAPVPSRRPELAG
jgi:transposase